MDLGQVWSRTYETKEADDAQRVRLQHTETDGRLLAVDGCYDHWIEVVPHVRAAVKDLIAPRQDPPRALSDYHVVAIGCPGNEIPAPRLKELSAYLHQGGFVFTTDLCLGHILTTPDWLGDRQVAVAGTCSDALVSYDLTAPGHPLLEGVAADGRWQVRGGGHLIKVVDGQGVEVLMTSPDLAESYGPGNDVILFTLQVGAGRLVHCLSHAYAQTVDMQGAQAAAAVLANLLDMATNDVDRSGVSDSPSAQSAPTAAGWFRLCAAATGEKVTIRASGDAQERCLDRARARTLLGELADSDGNLFYKYANKDGTPILEFRLDDASGWMVSVPVASRHRMLINGAAFEGERSVANGDRLTLFSEQLGRGVEEFELVVEFS